jgi:FkbM family methyltransferase
MEVELPDLVSRVIYSTGQWEPLITRYLRGRLKRGDSFIDVGANIGYYTVLASRLVGPTGSVVALEASARIAEQLRRNVALNDIKNAKVLCVAAAAQRGVLELFDGQAANSGHTTTVAETAKKDGLKLSGTVEADTLPNILGDSLYKAAVIKIDVEGAEREVLGSVFDMLPNLNAEWLIELTPEHCAGGQADVDEIFNSFTAAGYKAYRIPNSYAPRFMVHGRGAIERIMLPPKQQADVLMVKGQI